MLNSDECLLSISVNDSVVKHMEFFLCRCVYWSQHVPVLYWTAALRKGRMQIIFDAFDHQDVTDYIRLRMFNSTDPFRKVPVAGDTLAQQRRQQRDFQLTSRELASTKTIKRSAPVSILLDAEGSLEILKSRVNILRSGEDGSEGVGALMQRPALRFEAIEACGHPLLEVAAQIREVRAQPA